MITKRMAMIFKKIFSFLMLTTILYPVYSYSSDSKFIFGAVTKPYLPHQTSAEREQAYKIFISELSKKANINIKFKGFNSNEDLFAAMQNHEVNFAYYCHYDHSLLEQDNIYPIAIVVTRKNDKLVDHYQSYVVTKKSDLTTISSLKDKIFGLNTEGMSLSGFVYPATFLKKNEINSHIYFKKIIYYHGIKEGLEYLDNGKVDAIATWDDAYFGHSTYKKYNIIATINNLPNPPIVASNEISAKNISVIKKALFSLPSSAFNGLSYQGVTSYHKGFYNESIEFINNIKTNAKNS